MKPFGPPRSSIPSRGIPTLRGPILDDNKIFRYMLQGYYGEERKLAAERELLLRKTKSHSRNASTPWQQVLKLIE